MCQLVYHLVPRLVKEQVRRTFPDEARSIRQFDIDEYRGYASAGSILLSKFTGTIIYTFVVQLFRRNTLKGSESEAEWGTS